MLSPEIQFQEYEYKLDEIDWNVNDYNKADKDKHSKFLNKMAKSRWELIEIVQSKHTNGNLRSMIYYFRRVKIMNVSIGPDNDQ